MIKDFFVVTKFVLSFAVSLSALFAYIMAKGDVGLDMLLATFSVLLVAMGVSTLNQVQEYKSDAKMERTKNRPIAIGRMLPRTGYIISAVLILLSMILIYSLLGLTGVNIFMFAFIWYNAMYTPLKKRSALAVVPGAILGVIPPAIGWLVAGNSLMELEFIALALYFFIWQVPHFWLLVMLFHGDFKDGGYPTAMRLFGQASLQRLTFVWLIFTIQAGIFLVSIFEPYMPTIDGVYRCSYLCFCQFFGTLTRRAFNLHQCTFCILENKCCVFSDYYSLEYRRVYQAPYFLTLY
ncbi:MAG: UbiA family prenyltransferase [Sulfurovum sp.]|nr:UbiA family prenyltransferase [Sulfurovum sp.]